MARKKRKSKNKKVLFGEDTYFLFFVTALGVLILILLASIVILKSGYLQRVVLGPTYVERGLNGIGENDVVLVLDFGTDGNIRKFRTEISQDKELRAWSLLQQAATFADLDVAIEDNYVPVNIGGFSSHVDGKSWQLYVNQEKKDLKPFNVFIKCGDEVVFRFE
jgi:hypothetical protein